MAGKKKKDKKKKKDSSGFSHIASTLVPSSIFAAVPRTPTSLSHSWPRANLRTPSPLAIAVGEAGSIGRAVLGNFSRPGSKTEGVEIDVDERGDPVAYLTTNVDQSQKSKHSDHPIDVKNEEKTEYEEPGYEFVQTKDGDYDKATKFYGMSAQGRERLDTPKENIKESAGTSGTCTTGDKFYHVLEPETPIYAQVNKNNKTPKQQKALERDHVEEEVDDVSVSEYSSSDELTDVTSRHVASDDEENSLSGNIGSKKPAESSVPVRKKSKKKSSSSGPNEEDADDKGGKLTDNKGKSFKKENADPELDEPTQGSKVGKWLRRKSKKKEKTQVIPEKEANKQSPQVIPEHDIAEQSVQPSTVPVTDTKDTVDSSPFFSSLHRDDLEGSLTADSTFSSKQKEVFREVEKLGFHGVSKKYGLDDLSDDDSRFSPPVVPQNSIDFHAQTRFEREQFNDTLLEDYAQALSEQEIAELNDSKQLNAEPVIFPDREHSVEGSLKEHDTEKVKKEYLSPESPLEGTESVDVVVRNSKWVEARAIPLTTPASPGSVRAKAAFWNKAASKLEQEQHLLKQLSKGSKNLNTKQIQNSDQTLAKTNNPAASERIKHSSNIIRNSTPLSSYSGHENKIDIGTGKGFSKENTSMPSSELFRSSNVLVPTRSGYSEDHWLHAEPGFIPPTQRYRGSYHSQPREHEGKSGFSVTEECLREQQKKIEILIQQQQKVFDSQLEEKELQQQQQRELIQQQQKLQDQLKLIERLQREHQLGSVSRSAETVTSDNEVVLQKELIQQQQEILHHQHEIQHQYQVQQERILKHQEELYDQIKLLEAQQKQIQSNIGQLSPREDDLAEIRQREQQLFDLLNEQRHQQQQYEELSKLQRERLEEQSLFLEERKSLEQQQEALRAKVSEQETITRQLEQQLEEFRNEAATVARNLSDKSVQVERTDKSQSSRRYEQDDGKPRKSRMLDKDKTQRLLVDSETEVVEKTKRRHRDPKSRKSSKTAKSKREQREIMPKSCDSVELAQYLASGRLDVLEGEKSAMLELNSSLQTENTALKQLVASLQMGGSGSSLVFQQQVKVQQQEIGVLRNAIHRLNVELSRYQAKYRPVTFEDIDGLSLPKGKEAAPWLINTKYLAPLFLAYDDKLKEKERLIRTYDEELSAFRARVMEVVKENQQLHLSQSKGNPNNLDADEWKQLQEQAKLLVEENAVLMEHQSLQELKMKELQRSNAHEVSRLSKKLSVLESEKRRLETELEDLNRVHASLGRKHDALLKDVESHIPLTEHMSIVEECRRLLEDVKKKAEVEKDDSNAMIEAIKKQKQSLATKLADSEARITQLDRESEGYLKTIKKTERKVLYFQRQLEAIHHREKVAQDTLSEVLKVAEKTAAERDGMVELAKSQNLEQRKAATIIKKGDQSIRGLEEKLAEYKSKASQKVASVNVKLKEKEKEVSRLKEGHQKELNSLRELIRDKQRQLEMVMGQSRKVDDKLDLIWKEATVDNKRMKKAVSRKGGAMFDSDSDPNHHISSDEA